VRRWKFELRGRDEKRTRFQNSRKWEKGEKKGQRQQKVQTKTEQGEMVASREGKKRG
jgi:hypothetical protein